MELCRIEALILYICTKLGWGAILIYHNDKLYNNINPSCFRIIDLDNCVILNYSSINFFQFII